MVVRHIMQYWEMLKKIDVMRFFYYNYFCDKVIRMDGSKLLPYRNSIIVLEEDAKVYVCNDDLELGCDKLKGSRKETLVRLRRGAAWCSNGGSKISYGCTLELLPEAVLDNHYFTMNSNSTMVIAQKITLGNDVMIARNVLIYDSDFHQIKDMNGVLINPSKSILIGDHVWIGAGTLILKGGIIGDDCMIAAHSVVYGQVRPCTLYKNELRKCERENYGIWIR